MEGRRLAAILAADIAGYSALMGADEEATVRALKGHQAVVLPMIKDHGGRVIDTAGDGILAEFASVLNAVKCATEIQKAMTERNKGVDPQRRMRYRLGINLGDVVCDEDRIYGEGINIAARLESMAEPGAICISGKVHEEIVDKLDLTIVDLGEIHLKNIGRPVHVYQITGEANKQSASNLAQEPDGVFVGRQVELEALGRFLHNAMEGHGRLVMLVGEPGIGKSRTAYEFARHASERKFLVLWGRCSEEPGAPPYWPWVQIIRSYVAGCETEALLADIGTGAADILDVVPEIGDRVTPLRPSAPIADPAAARFRLFDAITRLLKNLARRRPLLLVLDDLHWADAPSLRLLQFMAPELMAARCLLLGTYRDIELSRRHPLSDTLGELSRLHMFERIQLTGLGREDVARLMESAAGIAPSPSLVTAVQSETEGNPFFLKEIVGYLALENALPAGRADSSDRFPRARSVAIRIPEGVKEVIGKRLNRLSAPCNQMLTVASVIGRQFDFDVLHRLLDGQSEDQVLTCLEEALVARVIDELQQPSVGRYQFSHALIRETLYEELITMRRVRLHRRVGEVIEDLHKKNLDPYMSQLAHHFCEATQSSGGDKAAEYASHSGELADAVLAFEEAVRFHEMALSALELNESVDEAKRCTTLLRLGEAQRKANEFDAALESFHRTTASAKIAALPEAYIRAALGIEQVVWRMRAYGQRPVVNILREAGSQLDALKAQAQSGTERAKALRCLLLNALARALLHTGAVAEANERAAQAVAGARELGDPAVLAASLACKFDFPWEPHATEQLLAEASEMVEAAERTGEVELIARGRSARFMYLLELAEVTAAEEEVNALMRVDLRIRQPTYSMVLIAYRFTLALLRGRFEEAEMLMKESRVFANREDMDYAGSFGLQMFSLRRAQGRLREIGPILTAFLKQHPAAPTWRPGLALLYAELDRLDEARKEFEQLASDDFKTIPKDGLWTISIAYLVEVCAILCDPARASTLYRLVLPYDGRNLAFASGVTAGGAASRYLGLMAMTMKRFEDAQRHFNDALVVNTRMGARPALAHTQYDYGCMLLNRAQGGDEERAADLLKTAFASAQELGMRGLVEKISTMTSRAPSTEPAYPEGLTAREVAVLRLIAIGRSNSDIATALSISSNTVATHVRSILAKTGSANRTEAAAYAVRNGLARLS